MKLIDVDAMSTGSVRGGVDDCVITIYAHKILVVHFPVRLLSSKSSFVSWSTAFSGVVRRGCTDKAWPPVLRSAGFYGRLMIQFAFPRNCLPILVDNSFADNVFVEITLVVLWLFNEGVV